MTQDAGDIWVANHVFLDRALFVRQRIFPVLLTSQAKALLNLVGASLWIMETEGTETAPRQ
ncbi:MAG: hypothetical protein JW821_19555, partial [Deltaproteobacteria bacterium]|nr:hypothetical protein [Deltaproteobacteria bacterium]